jgi:hypothetical protein
MNVCFFRPLGTSAQSLPTRIHQLRRQTSNWGWARWESKYSQEARQTPRQSRERSLTRPSKLLDCHWRAGRFEDTRHTYVVARAPGHAPRWAHNRDFIESNNIGYLLVDSIGTTCNLFGRVSRGWAHTPTSFEADKYIFCPTLTLTHERCLFPTFSRWGLYFGVVTRMDDYSKMTT